MHNQIILDKMDSQPNSEWFSFTGKIPRLRIGELKLSVSHLNISGGVYPLDLNKLINILKLLRCTAVFKVYDNILESFLILRGQIMCQCLAYGGHLLKTEHAGYPLIARAVLLRL